MFTFLNYFVVSPVFEDEEKSRIAVLLHIILLAIMVAGDGELSFFQPERAPLRQRPAREGREA